MFKLDLYQLLIDPTDQTILKIMPKIFGYFLEYSVYNPSIPMTMPFPGPSQCDGVKKLMIVGKIPKSMDKVTHLSLIYLT